MTKTIYTKIDKLLDLLIVHYSPLSEQETADEILYEEAERPSEIITACANAMGVIDGLDVAMLNNADQKRVNKIRRKALRLTEISIDAIYDTNIEDNDTDSKGCLAEVSQYG
jgi:hypothetical protein